jgi:hypothetical protein
MTAYGYVPPAAPESTVVLVDTPCRKCRYNLRGLSIDGRCPECGTPVGYSTKGDLIRYSDPLWVDMLRRGISCIVWSVVVVIVGAILNAILSRGGAPSPISALVSLGGYILYLTGAWFLTAPDPSGLGEDQYGTSRQIIRYALLAGVVSQLLQLVQMSTPTPDVRRVVLLISALASLCSVVGIFAMLNYLSKLALRIPDHAISDRARFLMYAIGWSYGLLIVIGVMVALAVAGGGPRPAAPGGAFVFLGCAAGLLGLALIVFGIMYLLMLEKLGRRLKEQVTLARQTWAASPAPAP